MSASLDLDINVAALAVAVETLGANDQDVIAAVLEPLPDALECAKLFVQVVRAYIWAAQRYGPDALRWVGLDLIRRQMEVGW